MKDRKLIPQDFTRSLEVIIRDNPKMTGEEILAEQVYDRACFELFQVNKNKAKLDLIKDINTNGGFYKGKFGLEQHYYYNITKARLEGQVVIADVEKIVVFLGTERGVVSVGDFKMYKETKTYQDLRTYSLELCKRTTKKDYDKICEYLNNVSKFWKSIK